MLPQLRPAGAAVSCGDETGWEEEEERVGSVGGGIFSLPALSQPGFQVSWNRIQSRLRQDGNLIAAGLWSPLSGDV